MTERNRRVERQMQADYERLKPSPAVSEWMESLRNDPEFKEISAAIEKDGVRGLDLHIAKQRRTALASAQKDDMIELSELVRKGAMLNADERDFVADRLIGAVSKQSGRPPKIKLSRSITLIYFWLTEFDGDKGEAALSDLRKRFGMARSTVSAHLKSGRKCNLTQEKIAGYRLLYRLEYFDVLKYFKDIDLKSG